MLLLYLRLPVSVQILHGMIEVGKRVDQVALDSLAYNFQCTYSGLPLIRPPFWNQSKCLYCRGSLISGVSLYYKAYLGTFQSGLNTGVAIFQGFRLEGVHYTGV